MAVPSFPDYNVTGAVHHYIQTPESSSIIYLGTAEVTPKVTHKPFFKDVMNDLAGKSIPAQKTHDGEIGVIGVLLNRYSKLAYGALVDLGAARGIKALASGGGIETRFARGALVFGYETFKLWQVFQNATDTTGTFRQIGMEFGYYWPQVVLAQHDRDTLGTEVEKLMLVMEAYPQFQPYASNTSVGPTGGQWWLYRADDDAFPTDVRVPQ